MRIDRKGCLRWYWDGAARARSRYSQPIEFSFFFYKKTEILFCVADANIPSHFVDGWR